jgi:hypothetical protein
MGIIKSYSTGFKHSIKSPRMLLIIYAVNIFSAFILVLPFYQLLKTSASNTTEISGILKNFSFTFFVDLLYTSGSAFKATFTQIKWIALLYWIVSVFLVGGIIRIISKDRFTISDFFSGASINFFRFLGSNIIVLFLQLLLFAVIWIPYYFIINSMFDLIDNEKTLIITTACIFFFYVAIAIILLMLSDYSKFYLVLNNSKNVFKSVHYAFRYITKNFFKAYPLYLLLLIIPIAVAYIYLKLSGDIGTSSLIGILTIFLIQQAFVFLKIWLKVWFYASQFDLYTTDFIIEEKIKLSDVFNKIENKAMEIKNEIFDEEDIKVK